MDTEVIITGEVPGQAVAAYGASVDNRNPLSKRRLAAMFAKASRRWA